MRTPPSCPARPRACSCCAADIRLQDAAGGWGPGAEPWTLAELQLYLDTGLASPDDVVLLQGDFLVDPGRPALVLNGISGLVLQGGRFYYQEPGKHVACCLRSVPPRAPQAQVDALVFNASSSVEVIGVTIQHTTLRSDANGIGIYHTPVSGTCSSDSLTFINVTVDGEFRHSLYVAPGGVSAPLLRCCCCARLAVC